MTNEETEQQAIPKEFLGPDSDPVYTDNVDEFKNRFDSVEEKQLTTNEKEFFDPQSNGSYKEQVDKINCEGAVEAAPKDNVLEISHRTVAKRIAKQLNAEGAMIITFQGDKIKFGVENLSPAQIQEAMCLGIHYNRKYIEQNGHPDFSEPDTEPKKAS